MPSTRKPRRIRTLTLRRRAGNKIVAAGRLVFGQLALEPVGHDQVLAACAPVRPRRAHVDHEAEEGVVHRAGSAAGRDFNHGGPVRRQVQQGETVDGVGVGRQQQRVGIAQVVEDHGLVAFARAALDKTQPDRLDRAGRDEVEKDLGPAHEIEVVVDQLRRRGGRHAVHEVERAEARLHRVGGHDLGGNRRIVGHGGFVGPLVWVVGYAGNHRSSEQNWQSSERLHPGRFCEISAVCTDPDYRQRGYARRLVLHQIGTILARGEVPMLHCFAANAPAIWAGSQVMTKSPYPDAGTQTTKTAAPGRSGDDLATGVLVK